MTSLIEPRARGIATLLSLAGVLLCKEFAPLASFWLLVMIPLIVKARVLRAHLRFLAVVIAPISAALFVVWAWLIGAAPGMPVQSAPQQGAIFAAVTSMRLAAVGGLWQLCFLPLDARALATTLRSWGLGGPGLAVALGALTILPEVGLRSRQVLDARYARGLIAGPGWLTRASQLPALLPPLMAWLLRSAVQRGDLWDHRGLVRRLLMIGSSERGGWNGAASATVLVAGLWVIAVLVTRLGVI